MSIKIFKDDWDMDDDGMVWACESCMMPCKKITIDESFDFAGTHCTHGKSGIHRQYADGSDCCHDYIVESVNLQCNQCFYEHPFHPDIEDNEVECPSCHETGNWAREY
jgi:hypothetical protein